MASRTGRAYVNPNAPRAFAICDRCGLQYNRDALTWQFDWAGVVMINRRILVCSTCLDAPQEQRRTIILPPDPLPIDQPRTEPYLIDEANEYNLRGPYYKPTWFTAAGHIAADVTVVATGSITVEAALIDTGAMTASLSIGFNAAAALSDTGDIAADVTVTAAGSITLEAAIGDVSSIAAAIQIGKLLTAVIGDTGAMTADVIVSGAGGDALLQEDGSALLLEDLSPIIIDTTVAGLPAAGPLDGYELLAVVQGGVTESTALVTLVRKLRGY